MRINPHVVEKNILEVALFGIGFMLGWGLAESLPSETASVWGWMKLWLFTLLLQIGIGFQGARWGEGVFVAGEIIGFSVTNTRIPVFEFVSAPYDLFLVSLGLVATMILVVAFNAKCAPILRHHFE